MYCEVILASRPTIQEIIKVRQINNGGVIRTCLSTFLTISLKKPVSASNKKYGKANSITKATEVVRPKPYWTELPIFVGDIPTIKPPIIGMTANANMAVTFWVNNKTIIKMIMMNPTVAK